MNIIASLARALAGLPLRIITAVRNLLYDRGILSIHRVGIPVISVGNLTVGGTGKTPLTLFIIDQLHQRGASPVVLSRGYGGRERGPALLERSADPRRFGDEPVLMARNSSSPVVVARDRVAGARFIVEQKLGDVIVLDDGMQHRRLHRNVEIATIYVGDHAAQRQFIAGDLLPLGPFREGRSAALRRCDMAVLTARRPEADRPDLLPEFLATLPQRLTLFQSSLDVSSIKALDGSERVLSGSDVVAFCAIAQPEAFFDTLRGAGCRVIHGKAWPDHHHFKESELCALQEGYPGLPLVCTEKDSVKVPQSLAASVFVVQTRTRVQPGDAFMVQIMRLMQQRARS